MSALRAMLRAELVGMWRTGRLPLLGLLAVAVGLGSPVVATLLPRLLELLPPEDLQGVELLLLREPGLEDALGQILKNFALLPVVIALMGMGSVAGERRAQITDMVYVLPLDRSVYLLAKVLAWALTAGGVALLALALGGVGAELLLGGLHGPTYAAAAGLLTLHLAGWGVLTVVCSALARGVGAAAGLCFTLLFGLMVLGAFPSIAPYTPAGLPAAAADLLLGRSLAPLALTLLSCLLVWGLGLALALRRVQAP